MKSNRRWITCPICRGTDMPATLEGDPGEQAWLVACNNMACPSNRPADAAGEPIPLPPVVEAHNTTEGEKHTYVQCECGGELIQVSQDEEDSEIYMAFYRYGHENVPYSWRDRLRHIWRILRHGHPYADSIVLSPADARKLAQILNERATKALQPARLESEAKP